MGKGFDHLPGWFRTLLCAVLLCTCVLLAWWGAKQYTLRFQMADVMVSLDTSRQRERKQQYEYDVVVAALPAAQAELADLAPKAEAAAATVTDLKAERKALRDEKAQLDDQLTQAQSELDALNAQLAELTAQVEALHTEAESLRTQAETLTKQK